MFHYVMYKIFNSDKIVSEFTVFQQMIYFPRLFTHIFNFIQDNSEGSKSGLIKISGMSEIRILVHISHAGAIIGAGGWHIKFMREVRSFMIAEFNIINKKL